MTRVGVVTIQPRTTPNYAAFERRLQELGYVEGQNLTLDYLNPEQQPGGNEGVIQTLINRKVDVIVTAYGSTVKAARAMTDTVPIVMVAVDYDPLSLGYVKSLSRPGGNITGVYLQQIDLAKKRLELLKDALPGTEKTTVFWDAPSEDQWIAINNAASGSGLQLEGVELRQQPYDYEAALAQVSADYRGVLIVPTSPIFFRDRQRLGEFVLGHKMPSVFGLREWVDAGGLLSYGANFPAMYRRVAEFVDMIAKGAKAADLPVEQPTKFELILNMKTAKAIGAAIKPSFIVRADDVIE